MKIALSLAKVCGKPSNRFYPDEVTIRNLEQMATAMRFDHVCGSFKEHRRSRENYISADCIVMDCDNDISEDPDFWIRPEDHDSLFPDVSCVIVPSRSNMKSKGDKAARPRFHVYFPIGTITDEAEYAALKRKVQSSFPFFDARDELEPAVLAQLRADCAFAREHEDEFVKMVEKKTRRQGDDAIRQGERDYADAKKRIEEIDQIINRLYEDKVSGGLSAERFAKMLATYEAEQETLRAKCETLQAQITAARTTSDNAKQFIRMVRKFTEMQELTPEIVATLIECVEVGQAQKVDGVKKQEIKIIYNFIGNIQE